MPVSGGATAQDRLAGFQGPVAPSVPRSPRPWPRCGSCVRSGAHCLCRSTFSAFVVRQCGAAGSAKTHQPRPIVARARRAKPAIKSQLARRSGGSIVRGCDAHADRLRPAPRQRLAVGPAAPRGAARSAAGGRSQTSSGVVLLGDVLELRHGPPREAMAAARPFFEDLGRALARSRADRHRRKPRPRARRTVARAPRRGGSARRRSAVEQLLDPAEASPMLARLAEWAAPARVRVAYPGLWLRPDVYATHGHYLDCHLTVPTLERLSIGAMSRVLGRPRRGIRRRRRLRGGDRARCSRGATRWPGTAAPAMPSTGSPRSTPGVRWAAASASGSRGRRTAMAARAEASAPRVLRGCARRALVARLPARGRRAQPRGARARCGRTSRAASSAAPGCERWTRSRRDSAWATPTWSSATPTAPARCPAIASRSGAGGQAAAGAAGSGARLVNAGSWTYASVFLTATPGESPYWPGTCVLVEDSGPPVLKRLLIDRTHARAQAHARAALTQPQG